VGLARPVAREDGYGGPPTVLVTRAHKKVDVRQRLDRTQDLQGEANSVDVGAIIVLPEGIRLMLTLLMLVLHPVCSAN